MRLDSLTGVRALAALLVFGLHIVAFGALDGEHGLNVLSAGMVGVSAFFILSGFVLTWTARPADTATAFYRRRFARVFPAYAAAWLAGLLLLVVVGVQVGWRDLLALSLLQSWFPDPTVYFAVNAAFWSLSCEAFFYAVFPLIYPRLSRLSSRYRRGLVLAVVLAVFLVAAIVDPLRTGSTGHWFLYFFPPIRLLEFVLGMLIALELRQGVRVRVPVAGALPLVAVAFVLASFAPESYMRVAVTLVPFAVLVVACAQADLSGGWSPFRGRAMVKLGVWSYCFYLVHAFVIVVVEAILERGGVDVASPLLTGALVAAMLVLSLLAAVLLHRVIEVPMERRLRPSPATASVLAP